MTYSETVRTGTGFSVRMPEEEADRLMEELGAETVERMTAPAAGPAETVTVTFSGKDLEMIRKYMRALEARSVEGAILHAVKVSLKRVYGLPAYDEYREKDNGS